MSIREKGNLNWLHDPNARPAKDLSKHDQGLIQLGWDARKGFNAILFEKLEQTRDKCPVCKGEGSWVKEDDACNAVGDPCDNCQGSGRVGDTHPERLVVKAEDQNLPEVPAYPIHINTSFRRVNWACGYKDGQRVLFKEGWIKAQR